MQNHATYEPVIVSLIDACKRVRAHAHSEQHLRDVRHAGMLLLQVPRCKGGRPSQNSSTCQTSYFEALTLAGIGRATAMVWQQVAQVDETRFERFIAEAKERAHPLTIAALRRACASPSNTEACSPARRQSSGVTFTRTLRLSARDRRDFDHYLDVLQEAHGTTDLTDTIVQIVRSAHQNWLKARCKTPVNVDRTDQAISVGFEL